MVIASDSIQGKFHIPSLRKSYSRIPDAIALPNLIRIQLDSYEVFKAEGLRDLLNEIAPIQDFPGTRLEMRFTDYSFGEPKYTQEECRERDATYAAPLRVIVQLLVKETGEVKEQEIFMGDFPLMTDQGPPARPAAAPASPARPRGRRPRPAVRRARGAPRPVVGPRSSVR